MNTGLGEDKKTPRLHKRGSLMKRTQGESNYEQRCIERQVETNPGRG